MNAGAHKAKRTEHEVHAIILNLPCFIGLLKFRAHSNGKDVIAVGCVRGVCMSVSVKQTDREKHRKSERVIQWVNKSKN